MLEGCSAKNRKERSQIMLMKKYLAKYQYFPRGVCAFKRPGLLPSAKAPVSLGISCIVIDQEIH